MSSFIAIIIFIIIFLGWKKLQSNKRIKKIAHLLDVVGNMCISAGNRILEIENSTMQTKDKDNEIKATIMSISRQLALMPGLSTVHTPFFLTYIKADADNDLDYIHQSNNYLVTLLKEDSSPDNILKIFCDFVKNEPPHKLKRKATQKQSYDDYYAEYINEVKELDKNNVKDGMHWLELTDDEGVKRAYNDSIPPKRLAQMVLENVSITDIGFEK